MLIAKCLWHKGEIKIEVEPIASAEFNSPSLTTALLSHAAKFTKMLTRAVASRSLTAAQVKYDLDDQLQTSATYVEAFQLATWFDERGVSLGTWFEDEYIAREYDLAELVCLNIRSEREGKPAGASLQAIQFQHSLAKCESKLAALESSMKVPNPVSEKQRYAYLNIIGGLMALMLGESPSGQPYSAFKTQQSVIDCLQGTFGERPGLSTRNLQGQFANARKQITDHV